MPFIDIKSMPATEVCPGCRLRTPHEKKLMLSYLEMDAGAVIPLHDHMQEQGGILLEGKLQLTIGDETRSLEPGAMFLIPANIPHQAVAFDGPAVILDAFSPIRDDYAELMKRSQPVS
ncbi:cupin domain-containing protein [bacterium]|nr:cupin domain-containing protein [bacterium]MDA7915453.1 cupin domain-containing protein [bacterium]